MRVLFAGTPEIAVHSLARIHENFEVVGVLTSPDMKKGRGRRLVHSPVKEKALELGLRVIQPQRLRRNAREEIAVLEADILAVYAYGRIFGPKFLSLFPQGAVNVHPSLLPRYRGSAPITAPIVNGDEKTGVSVQTVEVEVDSGDILGKRVIPLDGTETTASLSERMATDGAELVVEVLEDIAAGTAVPEPQEESNVTVCRRLTKRDGEILWALPAEMIERMVRAYIPWPKAYTHWKGKYLSILESHLVPAERHTGVGPGVKYEGERAAPGTIAGMDREDGILVQTGRGMLGITELQLEGKKPLHFEQFLNGNRDFLHAHLGVKE